MKRSFISGLLCIIFTASLFASENISFVINDSWFFVPDESVGPAEVDWKSEKVKIIDLPHTWNNLDITDNVPGYFRGAGWYKKELKISASPDKLYFLNFDAANQVVDVFINRRKVGTHIGGYSSFSFNVSDFLNKDGENNLIEIRVDNSHNEDIPPLSGDFNFFGGIYRDLSLEVKSQFFFDKGAFNGKAVYWQTPEVSEELAVLNLFGNIHNSSKKETSLILTHALFDGEGNLIKELKQNFKLSSNGIFAFQYDSIIIENPHLWSTDDPNLYLLISRITDESNGNILDETSNKIGFRWFSFDADSGFILNGKSVKIIGASRHQDYPSMGNAIPKAIHYNDVRKLKDMGGNFLRIAHYPQDQAVLDYCDELGILCSVEIPIVNRITESEKFTVNCETMLKEMLWQNYNHPSLVIWAYMNEVMLRPRYNGDTARQVIYFKKIVSLAKKLEGIIRETDPYRYTMIPYHGDFKLYHNTGLTEVPMILGWNLYFGWYYDELSGFDKFLDMVHDFLPEKPIIITEYGVGNDPRLITDKPVKFDFTNEFMLKFHSHYNKAIQERKFVTGGIIWNLNDFSSEIKIDAVPFINSKGINSFDRKPKEVYFYYKGNYCTDPFVIIYSPFGSILAGFADEKNGNKSTRKINVFTNLDSIELRLNLKDSYREKVINGFATFSIPFKAGRNILEAGAFNASGVSISDNTEIDFKIIPWSLKNNLKSDYDLMISCGDHRFIKDDLINRIWVPDKQYEKGSWGYVGGRKYYLETRRGLKPGSDQSILNTDIDPVYQTQRIAPVEYRFDISEGYYEIKLCFARLSGSSNYDALEKSSLKRSEYTEKPGTFNVFINNQLVLQNFDPADTEINYAVTKSFRLQAMDKIVIRFEELTGEAIINGIVLRKLD